MLQKTIQRLREIKLKIAELTQEAKGLGAQIQAEIAKEIGGAIEIDRGPLRSPDKHSKKNQGGARVPASTEEKKEMMRLHKEGKSLKAIAKKTGRHMSFIRKIVKGLPGGTGKHSNAKRPRKAYPPVTDAIRERAILLIAQGHSWNIIKDALHLSHGTMAEAAREYKRRIAQAQPVIVPPETEPQSP